MTKQSHTPGPWVAKTYDHPADTILIDAKSRDGYVEIASLKNGYAGQLGIEQPANARLIAAAPEMLEALKSICVTLLSDKPGEYHVSSESARRAGEIAADAIRKARGEYAKIRHPRAWEVFIERQLQGDGTNKFICHTGINRFLPDLYETQEQAIAAIDAAIANATGGE